MRLRRFAFLLFAGALAGCCHSPRPLAQHLGFSDPASVLRLPRHIPVARPRPQPTSVDFKQGAHHTTGIAESLESQPPLPFSPEWYAREYESDERLKRVLMICRGC